MADRVLVVLLNQLTRPLVTLAFAAAIVWGFVAGRVNTDTFLAIAGPAVGYYFAQRTQDHRAADRRVE